MKRCKQVLGILLVCCMLTALLPATSLATASETDIAYAVTGGNIYFDASTGTITGCDTTVTEAVIPTTINRVSVTSIGDWAFSDYGNLTSITIPDSVTSIGRYAFEGCTSLTSVVIPDSVTSIGDSAFTNCDSLTSVTIPVSVTEIDNDAFFNCDGLTAIEVDPNNPAYSSVDGVLFDKEQTILLQCPENKFDADASTYSIPDSVTTIGDCAFSDCRNLAGITIPDNVTSIGEFAFEGCWSLTSITIPASVTTIGDCAFSGCSSLTAIEISPDNHNYFFEGDMLFNKDQTVLVQCLRSHSTVEIPDSVTSIGDWAFSDCGNLTNITIPDNVTFIGDFAFFCCMSLSSITIPDSVTSIGSNAFYDCRSLTSITIPADVTSIEYDTFDHCTGLTSITIPDSVTEIWSDAFSGCDSLTDVYYAGSETEWDSIVIGDGNKALTEATIHYNSTGSSDSGDTDDTGDNSDSGGNTDANTVTQTTKTFYADIEGEGWGGLQLNVPSKIFGYFGQYDFDFDGDGQTEHLYINLKQENGNQTIYAEMFESHEKIAEFPLLTWGIDPYSTHEIDISLTYLQNRPIIFIEDTYSGTMATGRGLNFMSIYYENNMFHEYYSYDFLGSVEPEDYINLVINEFRTQGFAIDGLKVFHPDSYGQWNWSSITSQINGVNICNLSITCSDSSALGQLDKKPVPFIYTINDSFQSLPGSGAGLSNPFTDVRKDAWYYDAIAFVQQKGMMHGYDATHFGPENTLSRAQLAQLFYNLESKPAVTGGNGFDDVADSAWYRDAVTWATANKIVTGYGDGTFGPEAPVTREQLAVMLWRYVGSPAATSTALQFNDADAIEDWALDALCWAVENGIIRGSGDGTLDPKGTTTRAQLAQVLKNHMETAE